MPLASETELRRPLMDTEIREGVAVKTAEAAADMVYQAVYDAVKARLEASGGRLYGMAFPSIKGSGKLNLVYFLDWRGEVAPADEHREKTLDNHSFEFAAGDGSSVCDGDAVEIPVSIPELPPNKFRKETGQAIPVASTQGGKVTEKRVKYTPKRAKQ